MPSQGGALQAIGLNLPQIFINRTIRLQASSYSQWFYHFYWNRFLTVGAHALARGALQAIGLNLP